MVCLFGANWRNGKLGEAIWQNGMVCIYGLLMKCNICYFCNGRYTPSIVKTIISWYLGVVNKYFVFAEISIQSDEWLLQKYATTIQLYNNVLYCIVYMLNKDAI